MMIENLALVAPLFFLAALLFASVGHGGASAYLAIMALLSVAPESMRPAALMLNVLVATIALYKFTRVNAFDWQLFWPLAVMSVPFAFLGGLVKLPAQTYKPLVGLVLIVAATQLFLKAKYSSQINIAPVQRLTLFGLGAGLGLLSGLTGVGGGIFLSPIMVLKNWAQTKVISGVSAAFILANSLAGLLGVLTKNPALPTNLVYWAIAVVLGGWLGAEYGSKKLANMQIRQLLALVLLFAGGKMLWEGLTLLLK